MGPDIAKCLKLQGKSGIHYFKYIWSVKVRKHIRLNSFCIFSFRIMNILFW